MEIRELDPGTFQEALTKDQILIDFYADWCGPCRNMGRELEKFAALYPDIVIGKINIEKEENRELISSFDVSTIPSLFFFRGGQQVKHLTGFFPARELAKQLQLEK